MRSRRLGAKRLFWLALVLLLLALGWILSRPQRIDEAALAGIPADPVRGEQVFRAAGCADCHASRNEGPSAPADRLRLGGGRALVSRVGTFYAPNISPDPRHGIGSWRPADLVSALRNGISPQGRHYFPTFPYPSYRLMSLEDMLALDAYLRTLPPVATPSRAPELRLPFRWRRPLGLWKRLALPQSWAVDPVPPEAESGRYLAEALAACGSCHSPQDRLGRPRLRFWMGGQKGGGPNITPARLDWSRGDLLTYLQTGVRPDFTLAKGAMAPVIRRLATLPERELISLVAYLQALPAVGPSADED